MTREEIHAEWSRRLRSGKYKQGQAVLHNLTKDTWCCLGVLCQMAVEQGIVTRSGGRVRSGTVIYAEIFGDTSTTMLPPEVAAWAEMGALGETTVPQKGRMHHVGGADRLLYLTDMNDVNGDDFGRIADFIDAGLVARH